MYKIVIIGGVTDFKLITGGIDSVVNNLSSQFHDYSEYEFYLYGNKIVEKSNGNIHFCNFKLPIPALGTVLNFVLFGDKIVGQIDSDINPDIFHFQGTIPNLFLLKEKIKSRSIFTQHAILKEELKYQTNFRKKLKFYSKVISERALISKVKNFIFISKYNLKYVRSNFKLSKDISFRNIYNPVNEVYFNSSANKKKYNTLYFIGEIKKRKGLHDLLTALSALKKKVFYIIYI